MLDNVVGHAAAKHALSRALATGHPAHAYFLVGPPQVGKRTLALAVAQALLCADTYPPCGECSTCRRVDSSQHPDLLTLGQQERRGPRPNLGVEQVHDLQHLISLAPFEGRCRVAIIDGAERLTHEAANALLKTLEEPPPSSYLFLLSEAEEQVLPTIISRCQRLVLGPVSTPLIQQALVERWGTSDEQAVTLAEHARGRIGWAVEALSDPVLLGEAAARLDALIALLEKGLTPRLEAAAALEQQAREDPEATLSLLAEWRRWWEGVLLAKGGLPADERQTDVAARLSWASLLAALRATEATREQWQSNVNPLLAFEHLTLAIPTPA